MASLVASGSLIAAISPSVTDGAAPEALFPALEEFKRLTSFRHIPDGPETRKQRFWDDLACKETRDQLLKTANQVDRARLLAASEPHTAAWLQAVPVPSLGLHLDADTVRVAVALRLGAPICEPHYCRQCNQPVNRLGHHGLSCRKSAGRLARHANLNDVVKRSLSSAGLPSVLEPQGLDRGDGRRPDGLTLFPYQHGKCLTWDATCADTFAESGVVQASLEPGTAARAAETRKRERYSSIAQKYIFVPVAVETTGIIGPAAASFIANLGRRITAITGDRREVAWLRQRLSLAIIRGNAAAVLATAQSHQNVYTRRRSSDQPSRTRVEAQTPSHLQAVPSIHLPDSETYKGPPYMGFPNYGNSCYQNAALQSLLGLHPFVNETMSLISSLENDQCRTTRAVAKLMELHQNARSEPVCSHLKDMRDVFAKIDPAFHGTEMQDASEFLLRLLATMNGEIEARRPGANPIHDNFRYETIDSYTCTRCHETMLKHQTSICWFVCVPRHRGTDTPTLQDALRLSAGPEQRELVCQQCRHQECRVTTKVSHLPRTLILQLTRYAFLQEAKKIGTNVGIPKFLSLEEIVTDDVIRPPEWKRTKDSLCAPYVSEVSHRLERVFTPSTSPPPSMPASASPAATPAPVLATVTTLTGTRSLVRPPSPRLAAGAEAGSLPAPPPVPVELKTPDAHPNGKPGRTREDEDSKLREAILSSMDHSLRAGSAAEVERPSESCLEDQQPPPFSVNQASDNTYKLVAVISHYGDTTQTGHYVCDVHSSARDRWFQYDDLRVSRVSEADVLGDSRQKNGYLFFYMHNQLCGQTGGQTGERGGEESSRITASSAVSVSSLTSETSRWESPIRRQPPSQSHIPRRCAAQPGVQFSPPVEQRS